MQLIEEYLPTIATVAIEFTLAVVLAASAFVALIAAIRTAWLSHKAHGGLNDLHAYCVNEKRWYASVITKRACVVFIIASCVYVLLCTLGVAGTSSCGGQILYNAFPPLAVYTTPLQSFGGFVQAACIAAVVALLALREEKVTDFELVLYDGFHPLVNGKFFNVK